jgi:hypothetical protein
LQIISCPLWACEKPVIGDLAHDQAIGLGSQQLDAVREGWGSSGCNSLQPPHAAYPDHVQQQLLWQALFCGFPRIFHRQAIVIKVKNFIHHKAELNPAFNNDLPKPLIYKWLEPPWPPQTHGSYQSFLAANCLRKMLFLVDIGRFNLTKAYRINILIR